MPDQRHVYNHVSGICHRLGRDMPHLQHNEVALFVRYARKFISHHFTPISDEDVKQMREWFASAPYNTSRKMHLAQVRLQASAFKEKDAQSEGFIKWESYPKGQKYPRFICSPSDTSKMTIAIVMQAIDKKTFSKKWFVKGTQPKDWDLRMRDLFGESRVMGTDFSSFEAHHREQYSFLILHWVDHMTSRCGNARAFTRMATRLMKGMNVINTHCLKAEIPNRLMSGAQWTSSANGMLNLLLMSYMCGRSKCPLAGPDWLATNVDYFFTGLVEGDDGICVDQNIQPLLIRQLGLDLKFDVYAHYSLASFCGVVCDPRNRQIVCDPLKVLRHFAALPLAFASLSEQHSRGMLRAKALSYKYNFNNCPIVGELCQRVCDLTIGVDIGEALHHLDVIKREIVQKAHKEKLWLSKPDVVQSTRALMETVFKVPVATQLLLEEQIRGSTTSFDLSLLNLASNADIAHMLNFVSKQRQGGSHQYQFLPEVVRECVENRELKRTAPVPDRITRVSKRFQKQKSALVYERDAFLMTLAPRRPAQVKASQHDFNLQPELAPFPST